MFDFIKYIQIDQQGSRAAVCIFLATSIKKMTLKVSQLSFDYINTAVDWKKMDLAKDS